MAFPINPTNNQTYNDGTYTYKYNSTFRTWTKVAQTTANIGNVVTVSGNVTTGNSVVTSNAISVGNTTVSNSNVTVGNTTVSSNTISVGTTTISNANLTVGNTTVSSNTISVGSTTISNANVTVGNTTISNTNVTVGNTTISSSNVTVGNTIVSNSNVTVGNTVVSASNISIGTTNLSNTQVSANYLIANSGCVTIGTGIISVDSSAHAGIFASTVDSINLGLGANIVMGSPTGNVTVQGNLKSNGAITGTTLTGTLTTNAQPNVTSIGTLGNLSVTGNISTGNITVTNTVDAVNIKVTDLFSKRSSINISTNTVIDTFPISAFRSAKYTMRAGDGYDYQALEVLLVHNDINSIITVYGSLSTSGTDLVLFTTDISAGNVNVYATAVGPGTNLNLMGTYVPD